MILEGGAEEFVGFWEFFGWDLKMEVCEELEACFK